MYGEGAHWHEHNIYEQKSLLSCGLNSSGLSLWVGFCCFYQCFCFYQCTLWLNHRETEGVVFYDSYYTDLWQVLYWSVTGTILVCDRYYTGLWQVLYWSMICDRYYTGLWQVLYWYWSMIYDRYYTGLWHVLYWSTASNIAYQSVVLINVISIRNLQSAFSDSKHFTNIFLYSLKSVA